MTYLPPSGSNVERAADLLVDMGLEPADARECAEWLAQHGLIEPAESQLDYVGWGGRMESGIARHPLGRSLVDVATLPEFGFRRAAWDVCFGVVNGFKPSAILYYVATRSFSRRILARSMEREARSRGWARPDGLCASRGRRAG